MPGIPCISYEGKTLEQIEAEVAERSTAEGWSKMKAYQIIWHAKHRQEKLDKYWSNVDVERKKALIRNAKNTQRSREYGRRRYLKIGNSVEYKRKAKEYGTRWCRNNPDKLRARKSRRRAREVGAPGSFTAQQFVALCDAYGNKCLKCGVSGVKLTADHIVPLSRGGSNFISNIQPLCKSCNSGKCANTIDYRPFLMEINHVTP